MSVLLLQLSDPHFGTEIGAVAQALLGLAREQPPRLVVLSGDLTQRARTAQFEAARAFVDALGAPWLAVPGNHDVPLFNLLARVAFPYAGYRRAFGAGGAEPRLESADLCVAGVDTTRPWRHKHGELSHQQVQEVAHWLRSVPRDALKVVVTHHPLVVTLVEDRINRARGAELALRAWCSAGMDIVMSGHIHLPFFVPLDAFGRAWAVQAGTALSRRVRGGVPPSVNLVRSAEAGWRLERWDFDAPRRRFERVAAQPLARASRPPPPA
jgi:3',5'-cyclic AMP phosphodiesterase CpdA